MLCTAVKPDDHRCSTGLPEIARTSSGRAAGGREEEVQEEASSGELEPPNRLHLSSLKSAAGLSGVVKVTFNPSFSDGWGGGSRGGEGGAGLRCS